MNNKFYVYISSKCDSECVQTIYLCPPSEYAINIKKAEEFAQLSGWIEQAEKNGSVLIVLIALNGWDNISLNEMKILYKNHKNGFASINGKGIPGRNGLLWLWETMIYAIGYDDGADYLGNVVVKHPNFFAGISLINGVINDFESANELTDHWFVEKPTSDYIAYNKDIPVPVWLFTSSKDTNKTIEYFTNVNHVDHIIKTTINNIETNVYFNKLNLAQKVFISSYVLENKETLAESVMSQFFNKLIRWKNSPDGIIKSYLGKIDFFASDRFDHFTVKIGNSYYPYSVHIPYGMSKENTKGLPLVINLHGRGEPSWVFAEKNGWDKLADETQEFILVTPDSENNIWLIERDYDAIEFLLDEVAKTYTYDKERVYLTGFSNGAIYTCQQASSHPWLFAAASPWNGPDMNACRTNNIASYVYHPEFIQSGYEMPFWIIVGDSDDKAKANRDDELEIILYINSCLKDSEKRLIDYYTKENKFEEGDRFNTKIYTNTEGNIRVGMTTMKNMPHGAIYDESRATWNFMKRFRRINKSKYVEEVK